MKRPGLVIHVVPVENLKVAESGWRAGDRAAHVVPLTGWPVGSWVGGPARGSGGVRPEWHRGRSAPAGIVKLISPYGAIGRHPGFTSIGLNTGGRCRSQG